MARRTDIDFYELLPAVYRIDDDQQGLPLKALCDLVSAEANRLKRDIAGLWDDFFIETCADWVIPYIGDLVGNNPLYEAVRGRRADVAKTIYYRRRKGTLPMLEELARDVTGWSAHAVAFFELLGWTQNLNHLRDEPAPNPARRNPNAVDRVGAVHLRNADALDRLDGAFDIITHTVDVRTIRRTQGWYNLRNTGFFLWRLGSYRVRNGDPRVSPAAAFGFHFSPLASPAPLFTEPDPEQAENLLATEIHVRGPIRPLAFDLDLDEARGAAAANQFRTPPVTSKFFGPDRSVSIRRDGVEVSPLDVVCADLSGWERPPSGFSGVFSANLAFGGLSQATPEIGVTIGGEGPIVVQIGGAPAALADAARELQAAIAGASANRAFAGVQVHAVSTRLLVVPGTRGAAVSFSATAGDAVTITELGLNAAAAATGAMSGLLDPFPALSANPPQLEITIGAIGPRTATLSAVPVSLADARLRLEAAIQAADPDPSFTNAQVLESGGRLIVLPGIDGRTVVFRSLPADRASVHELRLASKIAVDVRLGRLAFAEGDEPAQPPVVSYNYGFSADMGGGPYDRQRKPPRLGEEPRSREDTVRDPAVLDALFQVPADAATIAAAIALWNPAAQPRAVVQVSDSRTYFETLNIAVPSGLLVLQAANQQRPVLVGDITVTGAGGGEFRLDGFWLEGRLQVSGTLGRLEIRHSTLVPGLKLDEDKQPEFPDAASLIVAPTNTALRCIIDHSIAGRLEVPREMNGLEIADSIIDTARPEGAAALVPALVSGDLSAFPALSSATPTLLVAIGDEGPVPVTLAAVPANLAAAQSSLETALQGASTSPSFSAARVVEAGTRLVILSGNRGEVSFQPAEGDATANELLLDAASSRTVFALLGGSLTPFPAITAAAPSADVVIGTLGPHAAVFAGVPATLGQARAVLEAAIQAADPAPEFVDTTVIELDDRLLVVPGGERSGVSLVERAADGTTVFELKLDTPRPSLAATLGGEAAGPDATFLRTTFFGAVTVREMTLASEVIFNQSARADRRQAGCVRFSSIATGSRTPRRYRCQPDLALEGVTGAADRALIIARLRPIFTSVHYGDPAYAQLALNCALEIRTGAEDGAEMGAFHDLMQPQREANLKIRLEEYLPFGLIPGLIYVT
jgi:hypothetical protein